MDQGVKFCINRDCKFYEISPGGLPNNFEECYICKKPLVEQKSNDPPELNENTIVIKGHNVSKIPRAVYEHYFGKTTPRKFQKSIVKTDKAIVIFSTAILKRDYDRVRGNISLKFAQTQFGETKLEFLNSFYSKSMDYEGNIFILLENSIKFGTKILSFIEKNENCLLIPYKYYLDEEAENLYLPQRDCSRTLIIDNSNFSENNVVTKYDMIILPDEIRPESDITDPLNRLMISFNLYILPIKEQVRLPFYDIGNNIINILMPLCNGYYHEKRLLKTNKNCLLDSEEKMYTLFINLLKNWLMKALDHDSSFPFHSKFFLLFLTFEKELIQPFSGELFQCLLHTMKYQKISTLLHNQSALNDLLAYQTHIILSSQLLHNAMKHIAEQEIELLINFLPLYHIIFYSQRKYKVAYNEHSFENNDFWGLPSDTQFQCNNKIELSIIQNAIENYCEVDPLLANSIIFLSMSNDAFPQLLELFPTHLLSFMCVLLYRVNKWACFIEQDYKLRETVFTTFLDKSEKLQHLSMSEADICQTCSVIFKMLVVINDEDETQHCIQFQEAKLILRVLAKLLSLFVKNCPLMLSEESFHLACNKIFKLVTARTLLKIVGGCLNPDVLHSVSTPNFVEEVANVWDFLHKIHYPESYKFGFAIDELFRNKLGLQDLRTILDALVNHCISYIQIKPSDTLNYSLCNEVISILDQTQTPEEDCEMCVRCLVKVPIECFKLIVQIFAKLLDCISKSLKSDPVKHILSMTWWPKLINYCQPKHLIEFGHDDAATLIESVLHTIESLATSLLDQSIKVKYLKLVIEHKHNCLSLFQLVSKSHHELTDLATFEESISYITKNLDGFIHYLGLMHDLKKLLDYTKTRMNSQILSYFLKLDYEDISLSLLCHDLVILPGSKYEAFLNEPAFFTMLKSLPHLLQSQFFMTTFANKFQECFKDNQFEFFDLEIVVDEIWHKASSFVYQTIYDLLFMNISLSEIDKHFGIYKRGPDKMEYEISNLLRGISSGALNNCDNEDKYKALTNVKHYFELVQAQGIAAEILEVKDAYDMNGEFFTIKSINEINLEGKKLKDVTKDMFNIGNKLSDFGEFHSKILKQMLTCISLMKWVNENLKNQSELDNFIDLALNQSNNSTFEVNRITCFKNVCRIFAPFIFKSQIETDQENFILKLEIVYFNIKSSEQDECAILKMSNDCSKGINLEFWKQLKFKYSSIGGGIISKVKNLISNGDLVLSSEGCFKNIEDIVSIQISQNQQTDSRMHSLHELKEMLSEVVLIRSERHSDTFGTQFQNLLEVVLKFSEIISKLYLSGSVFFRKIETCPTLLITYPCNNTQLIEEDTAFLESEFKNWTTELKKARDKHYFLNYFTSSQIITIQMGIKLFMDNPKIRLGQQLFHLLSFIKEDLLEEDVMKVLDSSIEHLNFAPLNRKTFSTDLSADQYEVPSQNEPNEKGDNALKTVSKSQLQNSYEKRTETILLSLDNLEIIFELFWKNFKHQVKRSFPLTFKQGEPNIIFPTNSEMLDCILSIYMPSDDGYDLPRSHEILVCSDATTLEDIDIFLRRSLKKVHYCSFIFCIAFIEKMKYEIAVNSICLLYDYLSKLNRPVHFQLFFLCSDEAKHSSYMATALGKYKRITPQIHSKEKLKNLVFKIISQRPDFISDKAACKVDPEKCFIRVVTSESAGNGKSLTILRRAEALKSLPHSPDISSLYTIITIHESEGFEDKAVQILIQSQQSDNECGRIYHFDLVSVSDEQLTPFLFKLLVTRTLCDNSKNIWCCSKNNYYMIEINLKSRSTQLVKFLHIFPTWDCLPPNKVLNEEKKSISTMPGCQVSQSDGRKLQADIYKRTNAYLLQLKNEMNFDKFKFNPKILPEFELKILLEYSGLENSSWSELNHFLSFLNNQLIACENNIYFQSVDLNKNWLGFKRFLIDCLIMMSRDFTTPSLRISLQTSAPETDLLGYSINYDRRWEQNKNPYIFFNDDLQTMTFFGISISKNLDQFDIFDSNRLKEKKAISRQLYNTLRKNQVDLDEDCNSWDRSKMISILANVIGIQSPIDPDPYYALTIDNLKKILAIQMRFRSNIPVILMGETGCGKTRLINFMCQLQAKSHDIQNFIIFKIHGEIYKADIMDYYQRALELAKENASKNIDTILFFDEVNTSYSIGLIKEILCDRRIDGARIPNDLRLQFVAACNPYRKHTKEMLSKLTSAGLGMFNTSDRVREHFGNIPLRELVYRVLPLPDSLLPLVWDFGTLDPESERSYIQKIVDLNLFPDRKTSSPLLNEAITTVLHSAQMFMRDRDDECSFVSLRDVERTLKVMLWFQQVIPKLSIDTKLSLKTQSLILAIAVCYRAKLRDRGAFDSSIINKFNSPLNKITDKGVICKEIEMFQDFLISLMTIEKHIAKNRSLKENLFMMFVCIQLKIPLFIIGKPGTSKSLAKHIISHSLNRDFNLNGNKIVEYTQIYMRSYQCSQLTTSKEIQNLFQNCQTIQEESAADCVACVVLDEVGLAEDSPSLPLKILHPLLDDGTNATHEQRPSIAFIGLSNWALDPAKMNRGIMVQLEEPTLDEIVDTAHSIIKSSEEDLSSLHMLIACIPGIAKGYLELIKIQQDKLSKDYFGLRDFYHLIKTLCLICKQYGTFNNKIIDHAILRNFGGITGINVVNVLKDSLFNLEHSEIGPHSDTLSLIRSNLLCKSELTLAVEEREKQRIERSRYLLLLTENYAALEILFYLEIFKNDPKVIFGSSFPLDQEYFGMCYTINRIKVFMETGKVVVLTNLSNVYESLYELLNLFYVDVLGKSWVDIGIGSQRIKCPVHPDFRLIVIADRNTVFDRFPPPLINRLEKHNLTFSTILEDDIMVKKIIDTLSKWIENFVTIHNNGSSYIYSQEKCFIGIQKDTLQFMICSSIKLLELNGREKVDLGIILDYCKSELLKIASPNSILRLRKSQLANESDRIYKDYCKLKLFDLANYLHELPNIRKFHNKSNPFLSYITTYSTLLTEFDIVELRTKLNSFFKNEPIISQLNLTQFKSEQEFIFAINDTISLIDNNESKRILIIQCENGQSNFDLISCAKYKIFEIITEMSEKLNSNYYFVFITELSFCQNPQYYSSFCGADWDSVFIDELRDSYHNMLPSFDQLSNISVGEIFDFQHSVSPELFDADRHIFQKKRLTRYIQKVVNRLYDPSERTDNRNADRINYVAHLFSNIQYTELADWTCEIISRLLNQSTRLDYSKEWSYIIALQSDYSTVSTTFITSLSSHIDDLIIPLFGGILAIIDANDNLELAFSEPQYDCLIIAWKLIYQDDNILPWNSLINERSLRSPKSFLNHSKCCLLKKNKFPFFNIIYQQINCIYIDMVMKLGLEGTREIFEDNFNRSAIGKILSSKQFDKNDCNKLRSNYLRDFVLLHMMTNKDSSQQYRSLYIIISVAASKCKRTTEDLKGYEKHPPESPDYNIPSIHIAYSIIKDRIAFVNEAFNLGFQFNKDHLILTDKWLSTQNNYYKLQNIDFDIFKYLIDQCWQNILKLQVKNPASFLENFANYSSLIEHNWTFFNSYVEEMSFLRNKWRCIQCVVLFVTHLLNEDAFKGVKSRKHIAVDSITIFETAFQKLTNMLLPDEDNFNSQKSIRQILDILKYVNARILLLKSDNIYHICDDSSKDDCGCYQSLWDLFQDRAAHFFLQLLMNITFSSDAAIKDDLLTFFSKFILNSQTFKKEKHSLSKMYLFNSEEIEPSPSLRCILLQFFFIEYRFSKLFNDQIAVDMKEIYSKLESEKNVSRENLTFLLIQSLEDSHHYQCKVEECGTGINYVLFHIKDDDLLKPFSAKAITHELIQSVAVVKFAIYWMVKWMTEFRLYDHYINSQRYLFKSTTYSPSPAEPLNLKKLIDYFDNLVMDKQNPDLSNRIQLYILKTLYFHVGYGELLKYQSDPGMKFFFAREYALGEKLKVTYLDLFYGIDAVYKEVLEFLTEIKMHSKSTTKHLKTKIGEIKFNQNIIFALFTTFISKLTSLNGLTQSTKLEIGSNIELKKEPRIENLINSLPKEPIDLQSLAVNIQNNKLFNMPQMKISEDTHLNTVFIAGVLCHVGILLQYTEHTEFLKPLTLIHYDPSALQNKFFPAINEGVDYPNTHGRSKNRSRDKEEEGKFMKSDNFVLHKLGDPFCRNKHPTSIRNFKVISLPLIRTLMHSIFIWTLHTKHFRSPHVIGKLVESIPENTYSDYFYLHLVKDIVDVATISNKTFEEAVLLVHLLFDLIIHTDLSHLELDSISTNLKTNIERKDWEFYFEKLYIYKLQRNMNVNLQEKMKTVILKSNNCDKDLLMEFYEDGETQDVHSMLWRHRDIIGYEHLLQVFNCQSSQTSAKYPLLEKFLKDEPLLNTTRHLPDYARLRIKLIQICMEYYNSKDISELSIGQFQEFIDKEKIDSSEEFKHLFTSLQIDWDEFRNKIPNSGYYFPPEYLYESIGYKTTKINHLIGKACQDDEGLLMSLIKVLVEVHNSFIHLYIEVFDLSSSSERRVSLSLVSPSHIIKYKKHQLDTVILSNATYSFRMGEGKLIHYDFNGIQNELGQRFIFSKPFISLGKFEMELPGQVRNIDYFRRLKLKIGQDELSDLEWNTIKEELVNPIEISEVISLIEMVVNFTSADGGQPNTLITAYLHETLKYPKKNNLISTKANKSCCLKHLSSLWHKLSIHKSMKCVYINELPFPKLSRKYLKKTDELDIKFTREWTLKELEGVITLIHDFIMFNLSVADEAEDSSSNLRESLINFSKSETIFNSGKGFNSETILTNFSVTHTVSIWSNLVKICQQKFT